MNDSDFQETLLKVLDRKNHSAWARWTGPGITPAQLLVHFQQEWLVFVRDFPRFLGMIHGRCPVPEVRQALAANLYEEETGGLSFHRPHPELFLDLMESLGYQRGQFAEVVLLPEAQAYRSFLDQCTEGPWVVGAAAITIWVEGSVNERRAIAGAPEEPFDEKAKSHFLVRHHGLRPDQLTLMKAHAAVEGGHRHDAWEMVMKHAPDDAVRRHLVSTLETACTLWHRYRDAVTLAAGLPLR